MFAAIGKYFPALLGLIVAVSLYDTFLIINYQGTIVFMEQNPIGRWLLRLGDGDVEIFVRAKLAGTFVVATTLIFMRRSSSRSTVPVTASLATLQLGLLAYLTMA